MIGLRATLTGFASAAALVLASLACGDGGPEMADPMGPTEPLAIVGDTIYAVDLDGWLLAFGTESAGTVSRSEPIEGLPPSRRIVGLDYRPSDGRLYGVGNDSRVYILDPQAATATPVSDAPFSPAVNVEADIHFGMGFDPVADKIMLVSAESGLSWTIDPDDGTAVLNGTVRYAPGDPNAGSTPRISGLSFVPQGAASSMVARSATLRQCANVAYALDADLEVVIGLCSRESTEFETLFELNITILRCGEVTFDSRGNLIAVSLSQGENRLGFVDPETGDVSWFASVPAESPIQAIAIPPGSGA